MRKYTISTDSTCDLPQEYIQKHNLVIQTLYYLMNDTVYGGEHDMDIKEFYDTMRGGLMPPACNEVPQHEDLQKHLLKADNNLLRL